MFGCHVRDIAKGGAGIQLHDLNVLPLNFELTFDNFHNIRRCQIIWRRGDFVGCDSWTSEQAGPRGAPAEVAVSPIWHAMCTSVCAGDFRAQFDTQHRLAIIFGQAVLYICGTAFHYATSANIAPGQRVAPPPINNNGRIAAPRHAATGLQPPVVLPQPVPTDDIQTTRMLTFRSPGDFPDRNRHDRVRRLDPTDL